MQSENHTSRFLASGALTAALLALASQASATQMWNWSFFIRDAGGSVIGTEAGTFSTDGNGFVAGYYLSDPDGFSVTQSTFAGTVGIGYSSSFLNYFGWDGSKVTSFSASRFGPGYIFNYNAFSASTSPSGYPYYNFGVAELGRIDLTSASVALSFGNPVYGSGLQVTPNVAASVPEPESWVLTLAGLGVTAGVALARRKR